MHAAGHVDEGRIAAEAFVGAQPTQRHLDAASCAALATNQVLMPSMVGRSMASKIAGKSRSNSARSTVRTTWRAPVARGNLCGERVLHRAVRRGTPRRPELRPACRVRPARPWCRGSAPESRPADRKTATLRNIGHEVMTHRVVDRRAQRGARLGHIHPGRARPSGRASGRRCSTVVAHAGRSHRRSWWRPR